MSFGARRFGSPPFGAARFGSGRFGAAHGGHAIPIEWISAYDPAHTVLGVVGVAAMKDIRTGAVAATQTEGLRQPSYVSGSHWEFVGNAFDGNAMVMSAAPTIETVVMSVGGTAITNGFYGGYNITAASRSYFGINSTGKLGVGLGDNSWLDSGFYSDAAIPAGFYTLAVELDGATKRCRMYLNGTLVVNAVATGAKYSGVPFLGAINNQTTPSSSIYGSKNIREFIRFPSILSDTDRAYYENLIAEKWA